MTPARGLSVVSLLSREAPLTPPLERSPSGSPTHGAGLRLPPDRVRGRRAAVPSAASRPWRWVGCAERLLALSSPARGAASTSSRGSNAAVTRGTR